MIERKKAAISLISWVNGDVTVKDYAGEYAFKGDTHLIAYTDYTGNSVTKNGIQANDSAMLLHRVGEFEGDMLFDPNMDTVVKYTASGLIQTKFILHTEEYSIETHADRVEIHLRYMLFDENKEDAIHGEQQIRVSWEKEEA